MEMNFTLDSRYEMTQQSQGITLPTAQTEKALFRPKSKEGNKSNLPGYPAGFVTSCKYRR
jgi:hypothetical protein